MVNIFIVYLRMYLVYSTQLFEIRGYLVGLLIARESYSLGLHFRGPQFSSARARNPSSSEAPLNAKVRGYVVA